MKKYFISLLLLSFSSFTFAKISSISCPNYNQIGVRDLMFPGIEYQGWVGPFDQKFMVGWQGVGGKKLPGGGLVASGVENSTNGSSSLWCKYTSAKHVPVGRYPWMVVVNEKIEDDNGLVNMSPSTSCHSVGLGKFECQEGIK